MQKITRNKQGIAVKVETIFDANDPESVSKCDQSFKDECDINLIMKRYTTTGELTHLNRSRGLYGDFSDIGSYSECLQRVIDAQDAFMTLPAEIRRRFENDPNQLIQFLDDPNNRAEAESLGILNRASPSPTPPTPLQAGTPASPTSP